MADKRKKILVTGGAGYIGSHTCLELLQGGYELIVVDNLSNSSIESLSRIQILTNKQLSFYKIDIRDKDALYKVFEKHTIDAVIHFAGLKAVGESMLEPLRYYENNVYGTIMLCSAMEQYGIDKIIFSSSATVYGIPHKVPITEDFPVAAVNPYGSTKLIIEYLLKDLHVTHDWKVILLRYFNPVGAHVSGLIGEDPRGIPNNLMPYIAQVAVGRLPFLRIYGADYPTRDGTGIRDYIHVVDLAQGHLCALEKIFSWKGCHTYNLGTGMGYSVLDMVKTFANVAQTEIPYQIVDRRPGDIAECFADATKAKIELNWVAKRGIEEMCRDTWNWQKRNPHGYVQHSDNQSITG